MKINYRRLEKAVKVATSSPTRTEQILRSLSSDDLDGNRDCDWYKREELAKQLDLEGRNSEALLVRDRQPFTEHINEFNSIELVANYSKEKLYYDRYCSSVCGYCADELVKLRIEDLSSVGESELPNPKLFEIKSNGRCVSCNREINGNFNTAH